MSSLHIYRADSVIILPLQDPANSIRDYFFGFMQFGPHKNRIAYDISFGTIGYSLILARAFQEVCRIRVDWKILGVMS